MKNLLELLTQIPKKQIIGQLDRKIDDIQYDSRKCREGSLFVAMRGTVSDGHNYISNVINQGAVAVVCEECYLSEDEIGSATIVLVENSRIALAQLSHAWFDFPTKDMRVIGITGTNGKTTITFLLESILTGAGQKTAIIGTTGIYIGKQKIPATHTTPESLELCAHFDKMRSESVVNVVMEVSSHALSQHRADGIDYKAGIFTNLTHEHLDYHKSMSEYANAKQRLFAMINTEGIAIVTDASEFSDKMLENCSAKYKLKLGRSAGADIKISNEQLNIDSTIFDITLPDTRQYTFRTNLLGRFNIDNAAFTASLCLLMDIPEEIVKAGLLNTNGAPGRMQMIALSSGAVAIVDYAHTPDALDKALDACRDVLNSAGKSSNRIISVFGCGGDRDKSKRPIMGAISAAKADYTIITDDNPRTENSSDIIDEILVGIKERKSNIEVISDRAKAIKRAIEIAEPNDIILVAGKGHENYQIIGTTKHHFDDVEELSKYV